jgi:hypothetical protein
VRAPASAVRFAATAVAESDSGIVRTVSIMWRTPPVNIRSWVLLVWGEKRGDRGQWNCHEGARRTAVTTVLFVNKPLKISTLEPLSSPSTLCPPVTFAYVVLVNSVGTNAGVVLKADAGTVPFRTW